MIYNQPKSVTDCYGLCRPYTPLQRSEVGVAILEEQTAEKALALIRSGKYFPLIENGSSILTLAIRNRPDKELVQELVSRADSDTINHNKEALSALMAAAALGDPEILDLLFKKGANPDLSNKLGETALFIAISSARMTEYDRRFLEVTTLQQIQTNIIYQRILTTAQILIKNKASIDLVNKDGKTPLQMYTNQIHSERIDSKLITLLIGAGAKPVVRTKDVSPDPELDERINKATNEGLVLFALNEAKKLATPLLQGHLLPPLVQLVLDYV